MGTGGQRTSKEPRKGRGVAMARRKDRHTDPMCDSQRQITAMPQFRQNLQKFPRRHLATVSAKCQHRHCEAHEATGEVTVWTAAVMVSNFYGNPERGWNDPPKLAFSRAGTNPPAGPGRHRLLNKRVPIPLNPQPQGSAGSPPVPPSLKASDGPPVKGGIPLQPPPGPPCPPPATTTSLPGATVTPTAGAGEVNDPPPTKELLEQVHASLSDSLTALSEKLKESTQEEIRRRLAVMEDMWRQDQVCRPVQERMLALTQALSRQEHAKAWALHQSLIVDYTTTCSPWMVGVKTLIAESRSQAEATPEQGKPADATPEQGKPADATPEVGKPAEATPEQGKPAEATPEQGKPAEESSQECEAAQDPASDSEQGGGCQ
ncbi:Steroid receptor RNA activator 1 [Chionoecetes opilio]|uniref:Steroid receptor RNA activator 1 n=1 Tax=Chionoecetes opilio TaxID=41210 RepID=A0A8J5CX66_CHIOP|nr:Steroid receptor RNA activator 1 [Chionoecetes opilio]